MLQSKTKCCTLTPFRFILLSTVICIAWNEYFSFVFSRMTWATLHALPSDREAVKILLVADPQLVGVVSSNAYSSHLTWPAIVDSDRYLSTGFSQAYAHVQPDVVVFLGDLFDEGSNALLSDYISYYVRFKEIFHTAEGVKSVYIWGDNDVGGEAFDMKLEHKMQRFEEAFKTDNEPEDKLWSLDTVKGVDFIKKRYWTMLAGPKLIKQSIGDTFYLQIDQDFGVALDDHRIEKLESIASQSHGRYKILLNHMTVFYDVLVDVHRIVHTLKADIIFSGHIHASKIIKCRKCAEEELGLTHFPYYNEIVIPTPGHIYRFNLNEKSEIVEITVPTCSYRNGEIKTGYGAALLGGDGVLQYTVLTLPTRYNHFLIYGLVFIVTASITAIQICSKCAKIFKCIR